MLAEQQSRGKTIRFRLEEAFEEACREYKDAKAGPDPDKTKSKRGIVRGIAQAYAILLDPEDYNNSGAFAAYEKEFMGRVK